jgi:LysM repeat protein
MNNQSPLVPQSSFLEQKNKGRTRVMIAVFVALSINGIGLLALLMQGCQKPPEATPATPPEPTNPTTVEPVAPPAPPAGGTEYTVAKGDTFGSLAKKFHVSVKAITEANPGVDPTKLKINQKLHIPAPSTSATPTGLGTTSAEPMATGGEPTYTVKSGDNLSAIAKEKGVTVKALRAANNLKTDRITVGQKLKIPTKTSASAASTAAPAEPLGGNSTGMPPTTPTTR